MRFGSVCSGIEAASVAWHPLGWKAAWLSEIEPFPSAVLAHHYPDVPNLGDMTKLPWRIASGEVEAPDVFCGGTPCQAFSVAGLRKSLDDARGNLSLVFCEIANEIDKRRLDAGLVPSIIFWENVPGVLSTADNAFGCFLAGLAGDDTPLEPEPCPPPGKSSRYWKWSKKAGTHSLSWPVAGVVSGPTRTVAWRVLDAQYFGVAQRRRRVFVVASARAGFDPAAVLFEFDGLRRDTAPSREARKGAAAGTGSGASFGISPDCFDRTGEGAGGTAAERSGLGVDLEIAYALRAKRAGGVASPVAFPANLSGTQHASTENLAPAMGAKNPTAVAHFMQVRRLTPTECERLQGFPDNHTRIPWKLGYWPADKHSPEVRAAIAEQCPDGPRYNALGNSWAVPVVRWIGARIQAAVMRPANDNGQQSGEVAA